MSKRWESSRFGWNEYLPAPILHQALDVSTRLNHILLDLLMTQQKTRISINDALSQAQAERTTQRLSWIDTLVDSLKRVFPERADAIEAEREGLHAANEIYVETLSQADAAIISRVTAIVGNEQIGRVEADDKLQAQLNDVTVRVGEQ